MCNWNLYLFKMSGECDMKFDYKILGRPSRSGINLISRRNAGMKSLILFRYNLNLIF